MNRRQFFKFGFTGFRDAAVKSAPDIIKPALETSTLDLTILTEYRAQAEHMARELLEEHFHPRMLRLKQSELEGIYPGGAVLYENNTLRDHRNGISLIDTTIVQLEKELSLRSLQKNPSLLRFVNIMPPLSRNVEIFHRERLMLVIPLAEDGEFDFEGSCGRMLFKVANGRLSVVESRCKHRTCVGFPPILTPGQRIICLPNQVTAVIGAFQG